MEGVRPPAGQADVAVEARVVNLAGCAVGALALTVMAFVPGLFGPGPALWVLCFVPAYAVFLPALVRGHDRPWMSAFICLYAAFHTTVMSLAASSPAVEVIFLLALFVIPVSASLSLPARVVQVVGVTSALALAGVTFQFEGSLLMRVVAALAAGTLSTAPALAVLELRHRLETARTSAELLSVRDPLTGLLNRRGLARATPDLLTAARADRSIVAVLVADLDHFKLINDGHGHLAGDTVLRVVADAVGQAVRSVDLVARTGGEEFCVVARLRRPDDVHRLAERIRLAVEGAASPWPVTVSVGGVEAGPGEVAGFAGDPAEWVWGLVARADRLLYQAKGAGRNASRVLVS